MPDLAWNMMSGMMGWMMALMILIPTLVILLAAALIVWAIRQGGLAPTREAEAPLTILQRRYARGDIGSDEYERMRAALATD